MKATGIVRCVDNLGRLVLPSELRRTLRLDTGDPVEFYVDGDRLVLKRYDAVGDMEQYLDTVARGIVRSDLIPMKQINELLAKVEEMKQIMRGSGS